MPSNFGTIAYRLTLLLRIAAPVKRERPRMSEREILLLFILEAFGPCPVQLLATMLDMPVNSASSYIRRLSNRGFIVRSLDERDARVHWLGLTPNGHTFFQRLEHLRSATIVKQINSLRLSSEDERALQHLIEQASGAAERHLHVMTEQLKEKTVFPRGDTKRLAREKERSAKQVAL